MNNTTTNNKSSCFSNKKKDSWCPIVGIVVLILCIGGLFATFFVVAVLLASDVPFELKLNSLEVTCMKISNNNVDIHNYYVSADLNLKLSFTNQDDEIAIEPLLVSIKYGKGLLSSIQMDPFYAEPQERKSIQLDMGVSAPYLKDEIVDSMAKDLVINQVIQLTLIIHGRYWVLHGRPRADTVRITCKGINI